MIAEGVAGRILDSRGRKTFVEVSDVLINYGMLRRC
jgi:hypothetical protein